MKGVVVCAELPPALVSAHALRLGGSASGAARELVKV